jgi:hypothetical protein
MPKITFAAAAFAIACALAPFAHASLSEQWLDYECSRHLFPDPKTGGYSEEDLKKDHSNFCMNYLRAIIETVSVLDVKPPPFCIGEEGLDNVVRRYQTVAGIKPGMPTPVPPFSQISATERAIAVLKLAYPCH